MFFYSRSARNIRLWTIPAALAFVGAAHAQDIGLEMASHPDAEHHDTTVEPAPQAPTDKRIFGVLPNYRTVNGAGGVEPLTTRQKFVIASKDSFDWPSYVLGGGFAAISQLDNSNPSFGQGLKGYGKRYAGAVGDQVIGNMLAEATFPSLLREDPRYFRMGTGSGWTRFKYAATRIFVTRTDAGGRRLNFSELAGNSTAVAISNIYYRDNRNVNDNIEKLTMALGTDLFSNIMKEFWPDIKRKLHRRHEDEP